MGVWIGIAEVRPSHAGATIPQARGAFVKMLACAESAAGFVEACSRALQQLGLHPIDFTEMMTWATFTSTTTPTDEFKELARAAATTGSVRYDDFMTFPLDEADEPK